MSFNLSDAAHAALITVNGIINGNANAAIMDDSIILDIPTILIILPPSLS